MGITHPDYFPRRAGFRVHRPGAPECAGRAARASRACFSSPAAFLGLRITSVVKRSRARWDAAPACCGTTGRPLKAAPRWPVGRARGEYGPVELLQALAESSPARVGDLAARRRLAFSTVSGLITQVINAGLVSRPTVPSDRRASAVALRSVTVLRGADRPAPGGPAIRSDLDAWRCAAASSGSFVLCTAHSGGPRQRFATLTTRSTDAMSAGAVSAYDPYVRQPLAVRTPTTCRAFS
ncbi:MarR family winged helix-turn-helix transcriptional regulator [Streptomyces sp. NPDC039022]